MIVSRRDGALRLVQQVEHGRVAGDLAAAWGNDVFERARPYSSVCFAAAHHDDGWRGRDARVLFDDAAGRPLHFLDIEAGEHVRLYRGGVRGVASEDVYAGVLVGMHWTGLYRGRWSSPGGGSRLRGSDDARRRQDVAVASEQRRWVTEKHRAWTEAETRTAFECRLWHNFDLLQLWDLLSLYLAVMPQEPGPAAVAVPWGPQLRSLEHTPQPVVLRAVAAGPGATPVALQASVRAFGELTLDPFPFPGPLEVPVVHTLLPDRGWSRSEAVARIRTTPSTELTWRLVPPAQEAG